MEETKTKIEYKKDTFQEYLANEAVAASDIKNFLKSPRKYFYEKNNKEEKESERHFAIGSAVHEMIMEPELFDKNYIVSEKIDRRTKAGKEQYQLFQEKAQGKTIIFENEMEMIREMSTSCKLNKTFMEYMKDCHYEISCYTTDIKTGLKVRLRPDILCKTKDAIVDIKTCRDSSKKGFKNDVYSFGYSLSAAYYTDFIGRENYIFAAVEKTAPYQTSLYALPDEMIDFGRYQYRMGLDLLKWSKDNNYWCDYVEFEILKECYLLGNMDDFFDTINKSELIQILT
jgi:hypothetical protein